MGASLPFGPWNMGVVWVVIRGWGVLASRRRRRASPCTGSINTLGRFALPLVALVVLAIAGGG